MRKKRPQRILHLEGLESRRVMAVGGGFTDHGILGTYFSDANFVSQAFTRKDVRLDFDWGTSIAPGGSNSPSFRSIGTDNYSVQWNGNLVAEFSETYEFVLEADDRVKLEIKLASASQWTTLVDQSGPSNQPAVGSHAMQAGSTYQLRVSYVELTGAAKLKLSWQSPSTPLEIIDPLTQTGINNPDGNAAFANLVNGGRNRWEPVSGTQLPEMDANGWPKSDAWYILEESLNMGLGIDPLLQGRIAFSFRGKADLFAMGNVKVGSLTYSYDTASNTTTGSMITEDRSINVVGIGFRNSSRTGLAGGPGGITDLVMMRPTSPGASTNYAPQEIFTTNIKQSLDHFSVMRFQLIANQQRQWSDRTLPTFFNQSRGTQTPAPFVGGPSSNGWSWEHIVMLANETGRDLMLSIPTLATGKSIEDADSYIVKLANLIRYGSDGVNPYTSPQSNPVYPPLNSNLHVYLELENELWNYAGIFFYTDWENLNQITRAAVREAGSDFAAINFDGLSTSTAANGEYNNIYIWRLRMAMLRTIQISNIFRSVFGDAAMPNGTRAGLERARIRPVYEWQYANYNQTAEFALDWADRYFNKTASTSTWSGPARPINYFLYGGGGATYYGAVNGNGLTDLIPNPGFDATPQSTGYTQLPTGTSWTFTGNAGIARDAGTTDDIPPAFNGSQVGYLTDASTMTTSFTVPSNQISDVYAFSFKAHNRQKSGESSYDKQNLRVYLDYGTANQKDITAKTYNQGNGYTPPSYEGYSPWLAMNVAWHRSEYYYTKDVRLTAGSTHTITIRGMGDITSNATNQTSFIEDVRVTSIDKIFADGMPGGGEATGQPLGQGLRDTMNVSSNWAAAFGLAHVAYEGGWSLGGDDGGSYVQLRAKYGDPRTQNAQRTFMDTYHEAGGEVNVLGTYAQWPNWLDYYSEQGLVDVGRYPIVQGIDAESRELRPIEKNGALMPQRLLPSYANVGLRAKTGLGRIDSTGGWISWNVVIPTSATYNLSASLATGGNATLLVDNEPLASGASPSGSKFLTAGLHSLMVRSNAGAVVVRWIDGAPAASLSPPDILSLYAENGVATFAWRSVANAKGYQVRYGTDPSKMTTTLNLDGANNTTATIPGLRHNQRYFIAVSTLDSSGQLGMPSAHHSLIHLLPSQSGDLASWDFDGLNSGGGVAPTTQPATSVNNSIVVGDLKRGSGMVPASDWVTNAYPNRFSSFGITAFWAQTFADSIAKNEYVSFTVSPSRGQQMTLDELNLQAWFTTLDPLPAVGLTYSVNGAPFQVASVQSGTVNTEAGITFDLRSIASLKNAKDTITFRIYQFSVGTAHGIAIGTGTKSIDMVLRGSTSLLGTNTGSRPWQNPSNPLDVSGGDGVSPIDVLLLINSINVGEESNLLARERTDTYFYDVDGDNLLSPLDVLLVVNAINEETSSGEGEESSLQYAPWTDLHWLWQDIKKKSGTAVPAVI